MLSLLRIAPQRRWQPGLQSWMKSFLGEGFRVDAWQCGPPEVLPRHCFEPLATLWQGGGSARFGWMERARWRVLIGYQGLI